MDHKKIEDLVKLARNYQLQEIEVKEGENSIKIVQGSLFQPPQSYLSSANHFSSLFATMKHTGDPIKTDSNNEKSTSSSSKSKKEDDLLEIKSPFVGTFYSASSPSSDNFVNVGSEVKKGQTLCIIEAMKLMNEIEAEFDGTIVKIVAENEQPIEYEQVLFLVKPK